jgi:hypothetical protein
MTFRARLQALLALLAAGPSGILAAQVAGLPVRNAGIGTGIGVAADVGFPNGTAGKGLAVGATGVVGLGPFGVSASLAHWKPKGQDAINSVGATGNLKIFGGPLIPVAVTLQAGLAYYRVTTGDLQGNPVRERVWHAPVGLGLALTIPNPVFSIKPWVAPRLDIVHLPGGSDSGSGSSTESNFGISGGVDFGFLSGLSIRVMYDRVQRGHGVHPSVLSLGLGFRVGK